MASDYVSQWANQKDWSHESVAQMPLIFHGFNAIVVRWLETEEDRNPITLFEVLTDKGYDLATFAQHIDHCVRYWWNKIEYKSEGGPVAPHAILGG